MNPTNRVDDAEYTAVPQGTLAEVRARGLDPRKVPCCAVPEEGRIKGCPFAERCATEVFGLPEHGGFGPSSPMPGSEGRGYEYIAYDFTDAASGTRVQNAMQCHAWMSGLYDRWVNQRKTGDRVVILGGPGTSYVALETLTKGVPGPDGKLVSRAVSEMVTKVCPSRHDEKVQALNTEYLDAIEDNNRKIAAARALAEAGERRAVQPLSTASPLAAEQDTGAAVAAPTGGRKDAAGNRRG